MWGWNKIKYLFILYWGHCIKCNNTHILYLASNWVITQYCIKVPHGVSIFTGMCALGGGRGVEVYLVWGGVKCVGRCLAFRANVLQFGAGQILIMFLLFGSDFYIFQTNWVKFKWFFTLIGPVLWRIHPGLGQSHVLTR